MSSFQDTVCVNAGAKCEKLEKIIKKCHKDACMCSIRGLYRAGEIPSDLSLGRRKCSLRLVPHLLKRCGHVEDVYDGRLEVDDADDHVGHDAKLLSVLSNPLWTTLKRELRRFGEIQHRYAIASAQQLRAPHLRSENSFMDPGSTCRGFSRWPTLCKHGTAFPYGKYLNTGNRAIFSRDISWQILSVFARYSTFYRATDKFSAKS